MGKREHRSRGVEVHLVRKLAMAGMSYTACGHIYGPLQVTHREKEVTCSNCRRAMSTQKAN
jgi:hypothetical protein